MAMRIITGPESIQGSPEWLAWRQQGIGASEAPIIMGKSHYMTPYSLFKIKTGITLPAKPNPAQIRGHALEPKARIAYQQLTGNVVVPTTTEYVEIPFLRASLDGMTFHEDMIVEIKCPGAEAHQSALNGVVPACFADQCQQQLLVTGLQKMHYYSFDGEDGVLLEVVRNEARITEIITAASAFWDHVQSGTWSTDEWAAAAAEWIMANRAVEHAQEMEKQARAILVSMLANDQSKREGSGVSVTRVVRKGAVDYEALLKQKGVDFTEEDMEAHRKASSESIKVSILKEAKETKVAPAAVASSVSNPAKAPAPSPSKPVLETVEPRDEGFILTV
jgi:putative phage-type endonuclease